MRKTKVLFVGSFKYQTKDGSLGGQMFACSTLIDSVLSDAIDWSLIDSTADSNITAPIYTRAFKAFKRTLVFFFRLVFSRVNTVLIFTADGASFIEKGLMSLMAKLFRKKVILAPRSGFILRDVEQSKFMRFYVRMVTSKVDYVVCQSQFWVDFFKEFSGKETDKLPVIHNWIDTAKYKAIGRELTPLTINVLFMSWVDRNKGIFDLVKSAKKVCTQHENVIFHIAGNGAAFNKIKDLVDQMELNDSFIFYGWVNGKDKEELLANSHIYVLPSHFEGFPNSLVEAMASGLAVISTSVGSVNDILVHKENGLVFEAGDVQQLSDCLMTLVEDQALRVKIAKNGYQTVHANNSIDYAVENFKKILL